MLKVLEQAGDIVSRKWKGSGMGWKVVLIVGCVVLAVLSIVGLIIWMLGKLVKSITAGGFRNANLYFPKTRR